MLFTEAKLNKFTATKSDFVVYKGGDVGHSPNSTA